MTENPYKPPVKQDASCGNFTLRIGLCNTPVRMIVFSSVGFFLSIALCYLTKFLLPFAPIAAFLGTLIGILVSLHYKPRYNHD
jgi:hypothetical protein